MAYNLKQELNTPDRFAAGHRLCAGCGAGILATAHGDSPRELAEKPLFRTLFSRRAFSLTVTIRREGDRRIPILEEASPC